MLRDCQFFKLRLFGSVYLHAARLILGIQSHCPLEENSIKIKTKAPYRLALKELIFD